MSSGTGTGAAIIVLELGSALVRVGVAGEAAPRACARAPVLLRRALRAAGLSAAHAAHDAAATADGRLAEALAACFAALLLRGLLARGAAEARVVLVEPALCPARVRSAARTALLDLLDAPQLRLVPPQLACAAACARATALVVDCGLDECRVSVVVEGSSLLGAAGYAPHTAPPVGAAAVAACATALLVAALACATLQPQGAILHPAADMGALPSQLATDVSGGGFAFGLALVQYAETLEGSLEIGDGAVDGSSWAGDVLRPSMPSASDSAVATWVESSVYERGAVALAQDQRLERRVLELTLPVPLSLARQIGLRPPCSVTVPGALWSRCFDVPFDTAAAGDVAQGARDLLQEAQGRPGGAAVTFSQLQPLLGRALLACNMLAAADFTPLHLALATALRSAPVDARRQLAGSVILAGGLAGLTGFVPRLMTAFAAAVDPSFDVAAAFGQSVLLGPDASFARALGSAEGLRGYGPSTCPFTDLRPLLPFVQLANVVAPQNSAFAGGSAIGRALASIPRLVPSAGSAEGELMRSDALSVSSMTRTTALGPPAPAVRPAPPAQAPPLAAARLEALSARLRATISRA